MKKKFIENLQLRGTKLVKKINEKKSARKRR